MAVKIDQKKLARKTMQQAAIACGQRELTRLSFKGSLDAILQFFSHMRRPRPSLNTVFANH